MAKGKLVIEMDIDALDDENEYGDTIADMLKREAKRAITDELRRLVSERAKQATQKWIQDNLNSGQLSISPDGMVMIPLLDRDLLDG